jgi:xanthine dehydrogenase large subunit
MVDAKRSDIEEQKESPLHRRSLHESGLRHTTGEAIYVDDMPEPPGMLHAYVVTSQLARATIAQKNADLARTLPGVRAVLMAEDVPGHNDIGAVIHDEPLLAEKEVWVVGQPIALVLAETLDLARRAAAEIKIAYEPLPPILTIEEAIAAKSFLADPHTIERGDVDGALAQAPLVLEGEMHNGAQEHFYLETQCSLVVPEEGGAFRAWSSTQHPTEVQAKIAEVLNIGRHQVSVEVPRMGGGFGGKETQAAPWAALAALGAWKTKRPVKIWLNRDQDMAFTGKRHPFLTKYRAGFELDGRIVALDAKLYSNGGWSNDLSRAITDRALFHSDNSYFIPNMRVVGQPVRTNLPSNTAFRGFGGPQGMLVIEHVLESAAEKLELDPAVIRARNFYGETPRDVTHYGQVVERNRLSRIFDELMESSDYAKRRAAIELYNHGTRETKRGLGFVPVKFGISFTTSFLNQAGALVVVYTDGGVQMNHGGTEMGQGLHTKMLAVLAHTLGVKLDQIRTMSTSTDKVPNTSATAASSGSDLNGQAIKAAAETIRERLRPIAARLLGVPADSEEAQSIRFEDGRVFLQSRKRSVAFAEVTNAAYLSQVALSSTGYYRTPNIHYDKTKGRGKPFHYYAFGAAVAEVEVSALTGEHRQLRVDILHDVGDSLVPSIDVGQVEGGFVQGAGWLTCEEVLYDGSGRLLTHSPDTYKIPAVGDVPDDFRVRLLDRATEESVIYGSKAVGEPPLMLAISVVNALRHAISAFGPRGREVQLGLPATPEAILRAITAIRG